jgi:hypothetical protein
VAKLDARPCPLVSDRLFDPGPSLVQKAQGTAHDVAAHDAECLERVLFQTQEPLAARSVEEGQNAFLDLGLEQVERLANESGNL